MLKEEDTQNKQLIKVANPGIFIIILIAYVRVILWPFIRILRIVLLLGIELLVLVLAVLYAHSYDH